LEIVFIWSHAYAICLCGFFYILFIRLNFDWQSVHWRNNVYWKRGSTYLDTAMTATVTIKYVRENGPRRSELWSDTRRTRINGVQNYTPSISGNTRNGRRMFLLTFSFFFLNVILGYIYVRACACISVWVSYQLSQTHF